MKCFPDKEDTHSMTHAAVTIQITPKSVPSTLSWMEEVGAVTQVLSHAGILKAIEEYVRFARISLPVSLTRRSSNTPAVL